VGVDEGFERTAPGRGQERFVAGAGHGVRVRDLRLRLGARPVFVAQCSCGWRSREHRGSGASDAALYAGMRHLDVERRRRNLRLPED
jgi:hypothetical protein